MEFIAPGSFRVVEKGTEQLWVSGAPPFVGRHEPGSRGRLADAEGAVEPQDAGAHAAILPAGRLRRRQDRPAEEEAQ